MSLLNLFGATSAIRVKSAVESLLAGRGVILVDDADRENEGDLIFAAESLTVAQVAQMIRDCSGIICLCLTSTKAQQLKLRPMVLENTSAYQTAFTVSIEAQVGVTTGVSAYDRLVTIKAAIDPNATPQDLRQPGHVFPLVARDGGVIERRGHTEGSVDLLKLAAIEPSAVLCELMNPDGSMQQLPQLVEYALQHQLALLSIEDIYQARL